MPVKSIRDDLTNITKHIATGIVTDDEMFASQKTFLEHNPTKLELWDMTKSDLSQVTIAGMRQFMNRAVQLGEARRGGKTAVIVQSKLQYGIGRIAEAYAEFINFPFEFRLFNQHDAAMAWLKEESKNRIEEVDNMY